MQRIDTFNFICALLMLLATTAHADEILSHGGDIYSSGSDVVSNVIAPRDIFLSGYSVDLNAAVTEDAHAIGFKVEINGAVDGNLYAIGSSVEVDAPVERDLTVSGFNVELDDNTRVAGNTRIAGATVSIDGSLLGALMASGGTIKINGTIAGDVRLSARNVSFGPNARIDGRLVYSAPGRIDIPEAVIPSNRTLYQPFTGKDFFGEMRETLDKSVPGFWSSLATRLLSLAVLLAFLVVTAAVFLAFTPNKVEHLQRRARTYGWRSLIYGFLGLSALTGALVVSVLTLVGIPFVPLLLLGLVLLWLLGYLLGVYVAALRVGQSMTVNLDSILSKLLMIGFVVIALMIVNFIPVLGWLINLGVVLFGLGAMTYLFMERLVMHQELLEPRKQPADHEVG